MGLPPLEYPLMAKLSPQDVTMMLLSLGVLLGTARILGEIAKRLNQPAVLGEILAGILLGPTVLGKVFPGMTLALFPSSGPQAIFLNGLTIVAVVLYLLVTGMEVDLSTLWKQGKSAMAVSVSGIIFPFSLGFFVALAAPHFFGRETGADTRIFAVFFATALSISALPVIARTLEDTGLFRSELGMIIVASAIFNDLIGWIIFAVILALIGVSSEKFFGIAGTIPLTLAFVVVVLTFGRWLVNRVLPWIHAHLTWPGGVLGFAVLLAFFAAAFTEWIGVHAIFGSFFIGAAIGDSPHLRQRTRTVLYEFISSLLAPLFFASIGLKVNFIVNFDLWLVLSVLLIACVGKLIGCGLGARLSGMSWRESLAVGFGMNSRGAMEIILGLLALQYELISSRMFVALVVMALVTSMMAGPMMQWVLRAKRPHRFYDFANEKSFLPNLSALLRYEAIQSLAKPLAELSGVSVERITEAVWNREQLAATGIGNLVAVPHAQIEGIFRPFLAIGTSESGVDFDSPDGRSARLLMMTISPEDDDGLQFEILSDIAQTFGETTLRDACMRSKNFTEFLGQVKTAFQPEN